MKRISSGDVSETLIKAIEDADNLDEVVILCRKKEPDGGEPGKNGYCYYTNDGLNMSEAVYLLSIFLNYILNL